MSSRPPRRGGRGGRGRGRGRRDRSIGESMGGIYIDVFVQVRVGVGLSIMQDVIPD